MVFLIAVAAVNTGHNLLYLILALLLSATLVSGIIARLSLRSVFVSLQVPENVFEKETVSIKISLRNRKKWFPAFSILVEDEALIRARRRNAWMQGLVSGRSRAPAAGGPALPVLHHAAYFPAIAAGEARAELISQSFAHRGSYHLDGVRLSTQFPFGFFRRGERVSVSGEVIVYPSIREISSDFHLLPFLPGKLEGKRPGQGESLYAIRKYHEEESARLIHWKATAKTGKLMARQYAREEENEFCLFLDTRISSADARGREQFEKAVALAASLAAHFAREAADFEYLTPREYIPRGTGTDHLYRILRSLAVVTCEEAPDASGSGGLKTDWNRELAACLEPEPLARILSEKVFKIIITSRERETLPASMARSSHVIRFGEL
jgi:uncharacterized protein (DUF58 family)